MIRLLVLLLVLSRAAAAADFDALAAAGIDRLPAAHLPGEVGLVDQDGQPVRLSSELGGAPLVFAAVQYQCPNLCGLTLDGLFAGLAGAGLAAGRDYRVVVVGIDPAEGPAEAARLFDRLSARWSIDRGAAQFLTGDAGGLQQVAAAMGMRSGWDAEHRQFAHVSAVALVTPEGRLSRWLMGVQFDPRQLRLGLVEAGGGKIGSLGDQVLLLCYGFDPVHGRYGWVVQPLLAAGGVGTLAGLLLVLWPAGRWRR